MMLRNVKTNSIKLKTKKGAASLYVVIFTTLLLGVITLSFIRIVISETGQTGNTDLSQSAYDSALAGIEDAKIALLDYHDCLSGRSTSASCQTIVQTMQQGIEGESCDVVRDVLRRSANDEEGKDEVIIQESNESSSELLQAYTCIKISEELPDYRTTLNSSSRTRILPLRAHSGSTASDLSNPNHINNVDYIILSWYSNINGSDSSLNFLPNSNNQFIFQPNTNTYTPPVVSFQLIQAGDSFVPNSDFNVPDADGVTNRAEVFLYPVRSGGLDYLSNHNSQIDRTSFSRTGNKMRDDSTGTSGGNSSRAYKVNCNGLANGYEFACTAKIQLPRPKGGTRSDNATFIRVGLPYGAPTTDFSIQMYNFSKNLVNFEGVQASVDSTGRANDLYRRVETRVELVDIYYPYPEFTLQLDGTGQGDGVYKQFYSTRNCWSTDDGDYSSCNQNDQSNY